MLVQHSEAWWGVQLTSSDTAQQASHRREKGGEAVSRGLPPGGRFWGCPTNITSPPVSSVSFSATQKKAARHLGTLGEVT